ncbi:MAG TPA: hypothetical protein O0X70_06555 [Methanocorpusculum sp.]|nr:hypothetical protein [Methanocorpusculum sp.]
MQAVERRKTITISPEVHRRIMALRKKGQTCGDVVSESIDALMRETGISIPPVINDAYIEQNKDSWDNTPESEYCTFEELDAIRAQR